MKRAIVAGADSFALLPQMVGTAAAAEILLTGDLLDAKEALDIGLVSKVVPDDQLMDEARRLADRMTVNAPMAVQAAKRALSLSRGGRRDELGAYLSGRLGDLLSSDDHQESVAAFLEKRDPTYQGR